jgi:hypothetical protein
LITPACCWAGENKCDIRLGSYWCIFQRDEY